MSLNFTRSEKMFQDGATESLPYPQNTPLCIFSSKMFPFRHSDLKGECGE